MRNVKIPISSCFLMGIFTFSRYHLVFTDDIFDIFIIIIVIISSGTPCTLPADYRLPFLMQNHP